MIDLVALAPFVPPEAESNAAAQLEADASIDLALQALQSLLAADERTFWSAVGPTSDGGRRLKAFLDSFLQLAQRRLSLDARAVASPVESDRDIILRRHVLLTLLRLGTPPARAVDVPQWAEHGGHILCNVPRLVDACALFGFSDPASCEQLVSAATLQLQPRLCASAVAVALTNASTAILHVCGYRPMHSNSKSGPAALAELPCALDARTAADVDMIAAWLLSAVGPRACARPSLTSPLMIGAGFPGFNPW